MNNDRGGRGTWGRGGQLKNLQFCSLPPKKPWPSLPYKMKNFFPAVLHICGNSWIFLCFVAISATKCFPSLTQKYHWKPCSKTFLLISSKQAVSLLVWLGLRSLLLEVCIKFGRYYQWFLFLSISFDLQGSCVTVQAELSILSRRQIKQKLIQDQVKSSGRMVLFQQFLFLCLVYFCIVRLNLNIFQYAELDVEII